MTVNANLAQAGVVGHPISHSLSPLLHRAAYASLGLDWQYHAYDIQPTQLAPFVAGLDSNWRGLSVTMPLKTEALTLAEVVEPLAEVTGAANTLTRSGGMWVAANTDVVGMRQAIQEAPGWQREPTPNPRGVPSPSSGGAVILGAGATAASALAAVAEFGFTTPTVLVRSLGRTASLVRAAAAMGVSPKYLRLDQPQAAQAVRGAALVISTLPVEAESVLPELLGAAQLQPAQVLLDVVYANWPGPASQAWKAAGAVVVPGAQMLLYQAAEQVRLMSGHPAPVAQMEAALNAALTPE